MNALSQEYGREGQGNGYSVNENVTLHKSDAYA